MSRARRPRGSTGTRPGPRRARDGRFVGNRRRARQHALAARGPQPARDGAARGGSGRSSSLPATDLTAQHGVRCFPVAVPADLAEPAVPSTRSPRPRRPSTGSVPDVLVNAAGVGSAGPFTPAPRRRRSSGSSRSTSTPSSASPITSPPRAWRSAVAARSSPSPRRRRSSRSPTSPSTRPPRPSCSASARRSGRSCGLGRAGRHRGAPAPSRRPAKQRAEGPVRDFLKRRYLTADQVAARSLEAVERGRPVVVLRMPVLGGAAYATPARRSAPCSRATCAAPGWPSGSTAGTSNARGSAGIAQRTPARAPVRSSDTAQSRAASSRVAGRCGRLDVPALREVAAGDGLQGRRGDELHDPLGALLGA